MQDDEELLPDLTPEEYAEIERQWLHDALIHAALQLRARAQGMEDHASIHRAVSKTIIDSVINGKRFIAMIWDARTQGTHGEPCERLVIHRYIETGNVVPDKPSGLLPTVLTAEELANANAAAQEFEQWVLAHRPVDARAAATAFMEIGQRHQSRDQQIDFIMTLPMARMVLADLAREGL